MKIHVYQALDEFVNETFPYLIKHEIQNNLIIGNCLRGQRGELATEQWFLATIKEQDDIKIIVMMTPPWPILIYEVDNNSCLEGLELVSEYLVQQKIHVSGIVSEKTTCTRFVDAYQALANVNVQLDKNMRIYRLDEVKLPIDHTIRKANIFDLTYLPYWYNGFYDDCGLQDNKQLIEVYNKIKRYIELGNVFIYVDGYPVSQVACNRKTVNYPPLT